MPPDRHGAGETAYCPHLHAPTPYPTSSIALPPHPAHDNLDGHYDAGRKQLRDLGMVLGMVKETADGLVAVSPAGLDVAGEVAPAPSIPEERLALWCERLPSPAPEMLR